MREPRLLELGEILEDDGLPRFVAHYVLLTRSDMSSRIFLCKRSCDFACAINEKLRHRTRFAIFQCDDADRCPGNRQVDS